MSANKSCSDYVKGGDDCQAILNYLPRLVMLLDFEGTIIFWNDGGEGEFGYTAEDAEGEKVWFLFPEYCDGDFYANLDSLKQGGATEQKLEALHKNGSIRVRRARAADYNVE
ncbi:MAG: PAS domain S-box protein [Balneolaceae bacterium]|nr:PAS domain S-box protein [Balneolaceae bacterium]